MLVKDGDWLKRAALRAQVMEAQEKTRGMVADQKAKDAITVAEDAGRDTTDAEQQAGRPLTCLEIQKRLRSLNPAFSFQRAIADPSKVGIYIQDPTANLGTLYAGIRFICGMESGISPEFSIRQSDGTKITGEIRGWRTVLATLINKRFIEKYATENAFAIHFGKESANWNKFTN